VVWIPKCRRKQLYGGVAKYLGALFHKLARERESRILEGHLSPDHVHMLRDTAKILGSPGSGVYQREEYDSPEICRKAKGLHRTELLGRGYYVSTVDRDEAAIRKYIQGQEDEDKHQDHLEMFKDK
jgi:putative transposase